MNKVYGLLTEFSYIREGRTRIVVSYNLVPLEDGVHATWCEVVFYKKITPNPSSEQVKKAILEDVDNEVKRLIIETFTWDNKQVWLSLENQQNYKTALDIAKETGGQNLPVKFKFGNEDKPTYVTFNTIEELKIFWLSCSNHITECLKYGWNIKDNIDWSKYEMQR